MALSRLGIVGCGLVGGSVALAVRQRLPRVAIVAADRSPETEQLLLDARVVEACLPVAELARQVDLVVVAVPPSAVGGVFAALADAPLVTDATSIKASVLATAKGALPRGRFVGSHPMAGSDRAGFAAASGQLFVGRRVYVCAPDDAGRDAIATVEGFWRALGAQTERIDAEEHDRKMAWLSHGVHSVAAALALAVGRQPGLAGRAGPGFLDTTRVALGGASLWTDILRGNRTALLSALDGVGAELARLRALVDADDAEGIRAFLTDAAEARVAIGRAPDDDAAPAPAIDEDAAYDEQ